jgi:hypothetical protein
VRGWAPLFYSSKYNSVILRSQEAGQKHNPCDYAGHNPVKSLEGHPFHYNTAQILHENYSRAVGGADQRYTCGNKV